MTAVWWILGILAVLFLVYLWLIAPAGKKPDDGALKGWLYAHRDCMTAIIRWRRTVWKPSGGPWRPDTGWNWTYS